MNNILSELQHSHTSLEIKGKSGSVGRYQDEYLNKLLAVLNESRKDTKYKPLTFARLNMLLQKLGKSKKNWSRDIFIGNVLDARNPSKFFWYSLKK